MHRPVRLVMVVALGVVVAGCSSSTPPTSAPSRPNPTSPPADKPSDIAKDEARGELTGKKIALLVGVQKYGEGSGLRNLDYAEKDAADLADLLTKLGYKTTLLTLSEYKRQEREFLRPNAKNIREHMTALAGSCKPDDMFLVAFSGHGAHLKATDKLYYCPLEADLKDEKSLVAIDDVSAALQGCRAGSKVLLLDACRNDPADGLSGGAPPEVKSTTRPLLPDLPGGSVALFSCSKGQIAHESHANKHGFLFHFVIEGLSGKAANSKTGVVTWLGLAKYVEDELPAAVQTEKGPKIVQSPEARGDARSLVLAKYDLGELAQRPIRLPKALLIKLNATETMEFVLIDPAAQPDRGTFMMGSSKEALALVKEKFGSTPDDEEEHQVLLTKSYYLGKIHVTRSQFAAFVGVAGYQTEAEKGKGAFGWNETTEKFETNKSFSWKAPGFAQGDSHPVVNVSWNDAKKFTDWLESNGAIRAQVQKELGRPWAVGLPSEAQWEYACRAGSQTLYQFGDDEEDLAKHGNVADGTLKGKFPKWATINAKDGFVFTAPAGSYRANPFGLYDMHGNAWQWCEDSYGNYGNVPDGPNPVQTIKRSFDRRVLRGGSWEALILGCRAACRNRFVSDYRGHGVGFRVCVRLD